MPEPYELYPKRSGSSIVAEVNIEIGMMGFSLEQQLTIGKKCWCVMPLGPRDSTKWGGRKWIRVHLTTMESVRANRDIIIANEQGEIKEHTPVEISYEKSAGGYQRVGEINSLPVTEAHNYNDYAAIAFTSSETSYVIGTNAKTALGTLPSSFEAKSLLFYADQDCKIRFADSAVQHTINFGVYFTFSARTTKIYVISDGVDGTLQVWAEG